VWYAAYPWTRLHRVDRAISRTGDVVSAQQGRAFLVGQEGPFVLFGICEFRSISGRFGRIRLVSRHGSGSVDITPNLSDSPAVLMVVILIGIVQSLTEIVQPLVNRRAK